MSNYMKVFRALTVALVALSLASCRQESNSRVPAFSLSSVQINSSFRVVSYRLEGMDDYIALYGDAGWLKGLNDRRIIADIFDDEAGEMAQSVVSTNQGGDTFSDTLSDRICDAFYQHFAGSSSRGKELPLICTYHEHPERNKMIAAAIARIATNTKKMQQKETEPKQ